MYSELELPILEKECVACAHMKVCAPFIGITRMLTETPTPAFDSNHLAQICTMYFSQVIVDSLSKDDNAKYM